jgi:hypothetical protein
MAKNVILDLDETLIHSPKNVSVLPKGCCAHLKKHHVFFEGDFYVIFERPFLAAFLRGLRGKKIAIWTAADKSYAEFIVATILEPYLYPDQKFEFVWSRADCQRSKQKYGVLKHVGQARKYFKASETLIVDDNDELVVRGNRVYTIPAFNPYNMDDTELLKALRHV